MIGGRIGPSCGPCVWGAWSSAKTKGSPMRGDVFQHWGDNCLIHLCIKTSNCCICCNPTKFRLQWIDGWSIHLGFYHFVSGRPKSNRIIKWKSLAWLGHKYEASFTEKGLPLNLSKGKINKNSNFLYKHLMSCWL
jgi:hypothetical protein